MRKNIGRLGTILLAVMLNVVSAGEAFVVQAQTLAVRETVETEPSDGNIIIGVEGVDMTSAQKDLLDAINKARYDACNDGITPDPRDSSRMLQPSDYVELKLGVNCTKAAVIRSAEAAIDLGHTRPNGKSSSSIQQALFSSNYRWAENLAWSYEKNSRIEGWLSERDAYLGKTTGQTGHYKSIINPNYAYTGMATFNPVNDSAPYDWACTAGQYAANDEALTSYAAAQNNTVIQKIEVPISSVTDINITGGTLVALNSQSQLELLADVSFSTSVTVNKTTDCPVYDAVTWTSSDETILTVDENGCVTTKDKYGSAEVTASIGEGDNKKETVREIVVGGTITGINDPEMVTVETGKTPMLSKTAEAVLDNGSTVLVSVDWEDYDASKLKTHFKSAEFDVKGEAYGFEVTQRVHVNAAAVKKVYVTPSSVTTDSGVKPDYPATAKIDLSNGYTWSSGITWDSSILDYYKTRDGGEFTITGVTSYAFDTDSGRVNYPVSATLVVNPATITDVVAASSTITTTSGDEPAYPKALVQWSNGDVDTVDVVWDKTEDNLNGYKMQQNGTYTITGSWNGYPVLVEVNVTYVEPEPETVEPGDEKSDGAGSGGSGTDGVKLDGAGSGGSGTDGVKSDGAGSGGSGTDGVKSDGAGSGGSGTDGVKSDGAGSGGSGTDGAESGSDGVVRTNDGEKDNSKTDREKTTSDKENDQKTTNSDNEAEAASGVSKELSAFRSTVINKLSAGKRKLTVKWKKAGKSVNGYQLQYSTKKNFKTSKAVMIRKYKTTAKTIKGLKSKQNYYVRIRTYRKIGGKYYYSAWSKVKSVKVK